MPVPPVECPVCKIQLSSQQVYATHVEGKAHKKKLIIQEKEKRAREDNAPTRPIVAKMMDEECASYYHDHGKGYKIGPCWINPDLCKVDRENQFFVRQERRRKKKESPKEPARK